MASSAEGLPRRLYLLGDGEVLDPLAEVAARLRYDEIHRADEPPAVLSAEDHVVVAAASAARARELLAGVLAAGDPGYVGLCGSEKDALVALLKLSADRVAKTRLDRVVAPAGQASGAVTVDELAIAVAAELVTARRRPRSN